MTYAKEDEHFKEDGKHAFFKNNTCNVKNDMHIILETWVTSKCTSLKRHVSISARGMTCWTGLD
jgi:hypothetical protein